MITNINNELKICGIYKITYDNNKIYIGQAKSIWTRAHEHNSKNVYPCDKALKKHSAIIEVLEKVDDILLLDEIENKWIKYYNATDKNFGYNILKEGNASGKSGIENCNAIFNEEQLNQIINLILNRTDLSYIDIAKIYNVNQITIFNIANGYTYYNSNLNYPLRKNNHDSIKKDQIQDYFENVEKLIELKEDLLYRWDLTIEKNLVEKYNIPLKIIRDINQGKLFENIGNYQYPIRNKNIRNINNFNFNDILNILMDLKNTNLSMEKIGNKYNINRSTVAKINKGESYFIKDYEYPAR